MTVIRPLLFECCGGVSDAQCAVSAPDAQETADSARLINAVNAGDSQTTLEILHAYGVAAISLAATPNSIPDAAGNVHSLQGHYIRREQGRLVENSIDGVTFQLVQ